MKNPPTQALFYSGDELYSAVFSVPLTPKGDINDVAYRSQQSIIWISRSFDRICISKTQRVLYWKFHVCLCISYWYFGFFGLILGVSWWDLAIFIVRVWVCPCVWYTLRSRKRTVLGNMDILHLYRRPLGGQNLGLSLRFHLGWS